eukprot:8332530-Pyramimonas_sp.AAC.2
MASAAAAPPPLSEERSGSRAYMTRMSWVCPSKAPPLSAAIALAAASRLKKSTKAKAMFACLCCTSRKSLGTPAAQKERSFKIPL